MRIKIFLTALQNGENWVTIFDVFKISFLNFPEILYNFEWLSVSLC